MSSQKPFRINAYEFYARYFPAILTALPLLVLSFYLSKSHETKEFIDYVLNLKFFGTLTMSVILLYFYAQLIRTTSKFFEQVYFIKSRGFPTTYFMLYSDSTYSNDFKDEFRKRVVKTFNLTLCDKQEESTTPDEAQRRLNDITKQIILKLGKGELVGKHNQWYGFFRNLVGGSIYGAVMAVINILVGCYCIISGELIVVSLILYVVYCGIFLVRKEILVQHAEAYACQLIAEFMNT